MLSKMLTRVYLVKDIQSGKVPEVKQDLLEFLKHVLVIFVGNSGFVNLMNYLI